MTGLEQLKLAAKAGGVEVTERDGVLFVRQSMVHEREWNSRADDGDALRLAVRLGLKITCPKYANYGTSAEPQTGETPGCTAFRKDPMQQTRVAIVTAAAEIGKQMKARA